MIAMSRRGRGSVRHGWLRRGEYEHGSQLLEFFAMRCKRSARLSQRNGHVLTADMRAGQSDSRSHFCFKQSVLEYGSVKRGFVWRSSGWCSFDFASMLSGFLRCNIAT